MSKLSPLGQSMASLFTPEAARLQGQASAAGSAKGPDGRINGFKMGKADKSEQMGDSLGNPASPGYEFMGKKKPSGGAEEEDSGPRKGPGGTLVATAKQGADFVRLSAGWEKLLVAQKKLCEKAKALFSGLEGPDTYAERRKMIQLKSRGCIVDLDLKLAPVPEKEDGDEKKGA